MAKPVRGREAPLFVGVVKDELVIRIGLATLADGYENSEHGQPFDERRNEFLHAKVTDPAAFAAEVHLQLVDEEEDGSTPVTKLLDKVCAKAVEDGGDGVEYPEVTPDG